MFACLSPVDILWIISAASSAVRSSSDVVSWLDVHNGAITALATIALAALTALLVWLNRQLLGAASASANAAHEAAEATQKAANAALTEAQATEKAANAAQLALELDYRPVIVITNSFGQGNPPDRVILENVGRGAALNVWYVCKMATEWHAGNPGHAEEWRIGGRRSLAAGKNSDELAANFGMGGLPPNELWQGAKGLIQKVVVCLDQAGNRYRFAHPSPVPDIWRPGDDLSDWAEWYAALGDL